MAHRLDGKNALVTGASSGLGRHIALTLARAGARVAVCARHAQRLAALVGEVEAFDGRATAIALDVTDGDSVRDAVASAESELGPITILVNNAGVARPRFIVDHDEADYDHIMDTNLKGAWLVATELGRHMIRHGHGGKIVNMSSIASYDVGRQLSLYGMSKAGLELMTRAMAREWARHDIQVTAIAPGFILTDMNRGFFATAQGQQAIAQFPRQRIGEPRDLDGLLLLLVSDASRFITGSVVVIDDGQSL
jgi:NAD(P)-dependent dehydrogenase (short-subunit alcohol dehydrogenase family)